ncbi:hypothetical protein Ancab_026087, partial [Ancistrocladus abbreviatus]
MAGDETTSSTATNEKWQQHPLLPSFPKLSTLLVHGCLNLTSLPHCEHVEELTLVKVNEKLSVLKIMENPVTFAAAPSSSSSSQSLSKLKTL